MFSRLEKKVNTVDTVDSNAGKITLFVGCILVVIAFIFRKDISDILGGGTGEDGPRQDRTPEENNDDDRNKRLLSTEYISPENNDMKICNKDECIPCSSHKDCNKEWTEPMGDNFVNKCVQREHHRSHGRKRNCAGCEKHEKFCECNIEGESIVNFKLGEENGYDNEGHPIYKKESLEPLCLKDIDIEDKDEIGDKYCHDLTSIKNKFIDYNIFDVTSSNDIYSQPDRTALNLKDLEIIKVRKPFDVGKPESEFHDNDSPFNYGSYLYSTFEDTNNDFFNCTCESSPPGPPRYQMEQKIGSIDNNIYCKYTSDLSDIEYTKYNNPSPGELRINLSLDEEKIENIRGGTGSAEMRLDEILFDPDGEKLEINNENEFKRYFKCSDESKQLYQINDSSPHMATCSTLYGGIQLPYKCMDRCDTNLRIPEESIQIRDGKTIDSFRTYINGKKDDIYKGISVSDYLQCKPGYHQVKTFKLECLNIDSSPLFNIDAMCRKLDNCKDYYVENNEEYPIGAEKIKCGSSASPCSVVCPHTDFECGPDLGFCESPIYTGGPSENLEYSIGNTIGIKEKYMCCQGNTLQEFYTKTKGLDFCASPLKSLYNILYELKVAPSISQEEAIHNEPNLVNVPDDIKNGSSIHTSIKSLPFCFRTCENENVKCGDDELKIENKPLPLNASPSNYDFKKQCCINKDYFDNYNKKNNNKFKNPNEIYKNHYNNLLSSRYQPEDFYDGGEIKTQGMCGPKYNYMGQGDKADDSSLHKMGLYGLQKFKKLNGLLGVEDVPAKDINTSKFDYICYHLREDGECEKQGEFCISSAVPAKERVEFKLDEDEDKDEYTAVDLKFETAGNGHPQVSCIADIDGKDGGNIDIIDIEHSCNVKRIAYKDKKGNIIEKNKFKQGKDFVDCKAPIKIKKDDKEIKPEHSIETGNIYGKYTTCLDGYDKTNFSIIEETATNKMCPTNFIPINPKGANCDIKNKKDCNLDKSCFYNVEQQRCESLPRATCREIRPPGRVNSGAPGYQQIFTTGETNNPNGKMISSERCSAKEGYLEEEHYNGINYNDDYLIEPIVKNLINCNDDKMKFDLSDLKREEEYKNFLRQGYNLIKDKPLCQPGYILNTTDNNEFICSPCPPIENINYGILNKCRLNNDSLLASPNTIKDYDIEKLKPINEHGRNICRNFYTFDPSNNKCNPIQCTIPETMIKGVVSGVVNSNSNKSEKLLTQNKPSGEITYKYEKGEDKDNYGGYSFNVPFNKPNSNYYCSNDKYALRDKCFGIHSKGDLKNTPSSSPPKIFESSPCHNYIDYTSYYTNQRDCLDNNHIWFKGNSPLGDGKGNGRCVDVNDYKNDSLIEILMDAGFDRSNPSIISKEYSKFLEKNYDKIIDDLNHRLGYSGMSSSQEPLMEGFTGSSNPCGCDEFSVLKKTVDSCGKGKPLSTCSMELKSPLEALQGKIEECHINNDNYIKQYYDKVNYLVDNDNNDNNEMGTDYNLLIPYIEEHCSQIVPDGPPSDTPKASIPEININDNPNTDDTEVPPGINQGTMDISSFASPGIIELNQMLTNYIATTYPDNLDHGKNYHYTANKLDNPSNSWSTKKQPINSNLFSSMSGSPVEIDLYGNIKDGITEFEDWFDSPQTCGWVADLSNTDNIKAKDVLARKCNRSFYIGLEYDQTSNDFKGNIQDSIGGYEMFDIVDDFYKENLFYFNVDESNYDALKIDPHPPSPVNQKVKGDNLPSFCNAHVQENPNMVVCSYNKINKDNFASPGEALQEIKNEYLGYIKEGTGSRKHYKSIDGRNISYKEDPLYGQSVNNKLSMSDFKTKSNKMLSDGSGGSLGWDDSWISDDDARIGTAKTMNANLIQDNSIKLGICDKGFTPMKITMPNGKEVDKCIQQNCGLKYSLNHAYYSHPKNRNGDKMTLIQEINANKTLKKYTKEGVKSTPGKTTWGEIMNESNSIPWPILKAQSYMECQIKNEEANNIEIYQHGQRDLFTEIQKDKNGKIVEIWSNAEKKTRTSDLNIALRDHKSKSGTGGGRTMRYIPFNTYYTTNSNSYNNHYNCDNYNFLIWKSWYEAINEVSSDTSNSSITNFADKVLGKNKEEYIGGGGMGIFTDFEKLNEYYNSVFTREAWGGVSGSYDAPISNAPGYEKFLGEIDGRDIIFKNNNLPENWLFAGSDKGKTKELWKYAIMKLLPIFESKLFFIPPLGFCQNNPNPSKFTDINWGGLLDDSKVWKKDDKDGLNTFKALNVMGGSNLEIPSSFDWKIIKKNPNGDAPEIPKTLKPRGQTTKLISKGNESIPGFRRGSYGRGGDELSGSSFVLDKIATYDFDQLYNRYELDHENGVISDYGDECTGTVVGGEWDGFTCADVVKNMSREKGETWCRKEPGCTFTPGPIENKTSELKKIMKEENSGWSIINDTYNHLGDNVNYINSNWFGKDKGMGNIAAPAISSESNIYIDDSAKNPSINFDSQKDFPNPNLNIFDYKPGNRGYYDPFDLDLKNYKDDVLKSEQVYVPSLNVYNKHFKNKFVDYKDWVGKTCFGYSDKMENVKKDNISQQNFIIAQFNIMLGGEGKRPILRISEKNNPCSERLTDVEFQTAIRADAYCSVSSPHLENCGYDNPVIANSGSGGDGNQDHMFYQECTNGKDNCEKPATRVPKYNHLDIRNVTDNYKMGRKSIFNKWIPKTADDTDNTYVQLCNHNNDCINNDCRYLKINDVTAGLPLIWTDGDDRFWMFDESTQRGIPDFSSSNTYMPWTHFGELRNVPNTLKFNNPARVGEYSTPETSGENNPDATYNIGICAAPEGSNSATNIFQAPFRANIYSDALSGSGELPTRYPRHVEYRDRRSEGVNSNSQVVPSGFREWGQGIAFPGWSWTTPPENWAQMGYHSRATYSNVQRADGALSINDSKSICHSNNMKMHSKNDGVLSRTHLLGNDPPPTLGIYQAQDGPKDWAKPADKPRIGCT